MDLLKSIFLIIDLRSLYSTISYRYFNILLLPYFVITLIGCNQEEKVQSVEQKNNIYYSLDSAFQKIGFNPLQKGSWFFVTAGDMHYKEDGSSRGGDFIIDQINLMNPSPEFYIIPGDIVNHMSASMAEVPSEEDIIIAKKEFQYAVDDLSRLSKDVNSIVALGNHDTYPNEIDSIGGRVFNQYFDTVPKLFSYNGVHFLIIDSDSHANYNINGQEKIVKNYCIEHVKSSETVIVVQHFPYVGQNFTTGLPSLLYNLFFDHTGEVWNIVGHDHLDRDRLYLLPQTRTVENTVSKGYTIYCIEKSRVIGRIIHPREKGAYTILEYPKEAKGKVLRPFEDIDGVVWQAVIGRDINNTDCPYLISSSANDGITNWVYTKQLEYHFPYPDSAPKRFGLMVHRFFYSSKDENGNSNNGTVWASLDGSDWIQMSYVNHVHDVAIYEIPLEFRKNNLELYIKIKGANFKPPHPAAGKPMDNIIGGFAFIQ